jgi:glutamyl-tRNA(Gln) amidotransferase subunit E
LSERAESGALVGIEVHQQLACTTKLFCACPPVKSEEFPYSFERKLRPAQSETGHLDPAAVFEFAKGKSDVYYWSPESACLVDADEEPPHIPSQESIDAALIMAKTLGASIVDELHVMRKIVIDGSNTAGFQRTVVVGLGGGITVEGTKVGVQSVTLEEDAARIMGEDEGSRRFALDRLGVPLVEVALDPIRGDPALVEQVALYLGRMLRSTGRVARGLGTIRQDLNVSTGGGSVVEVKGVQKLNLLPKVVDYELRRQRGLISLSRRLKESGVEKVECTSKDVTSSMGNSGSSLVRENASGGSKVVCVSATGLAGQIAWEPTPGIRLGKELAEISRANSLGGVIHSDEFEEQGITSNEEERLKTEMAAGPKDALVLVAGPEDLLGKVVPLIEARLRATVDGVPPETRAATDLGETRYMRPRPGSQRMYPETDIPDMIIGKKELKEIAKGVPRNWESMVEGIRRRYELSTDLALKLFDSDLLDEFTALTASLSLGPSFVASVLADLPARLQREGVPEEAFSASMLKEVLVAVDTGLVAKEVVPDILREAGTKGVSVSQAIRSMGLTGADETEVKRVVEAIIGSKRELISQKGEAAFSALMGEAMKELRGKADGAMVGRVLKERLATYVRENG